MEIPLVAFKCLVGSYMLAYIIGMVYGWFNYANADDTYFFYPLFYCFMNTVVWGFILGGWYIIR